MSLSSQASGYLSSSSSSLQTSLSSSSLTEPPSEDAHALGGGGEPAAIGDGWDDDPAIALADDAAAGWRSGVTLRQGWEFLENEGSGKTVDLASAAAGINRLSLAETVKTVTPSAHRSNRSSTDRLSALEPSPVLAPSPPPTATSGGGGGGRTSRAASVGASASMPAHAEETGSAGVRSKPSPSPLLPAGPGVKSSLLQVSPQPTGQAERPDLSQPSPLPAVSPRAVPQRSPTPTDPSRAASPSLCASIDAWAANVPLSPGSSLRHLHHYHATGGASGTRTPERRAQHHRSIEPSARVATAPPRHANTAETASADGTQTHRRAKSSLPVITTPAEGESKSGAAATPTRPHKPRWLQASPSFSSPNLSAQALSDTSRTPRGPSPAEGALSLSSHKPDGSSGRTRRMSPLPSASSSSLAKGDKSGSATPLGLSSAPLLPPRPAAEVQKQSAEAEFTPSSTSASKSGGVAPPPSHPSVSSGGGGGSGGRAFVASNGLKGRLAAFGGMVGGAATQIYQENLAGAQSSGNLASLASGTTSGGGLASGRDPASYTSYMSQAAPPRQPAAAAPKSSRGFQHAILSAPSSGVKMFNTAWKGKSAASSSAGTPRAELIDGEGSTPIMFSPTGSVAPGAEGRVFGKDVVAVARQWGVREGVPMKRSGSVDEVSIKGSSIDQVSRESLPALVVRCVEYRALLLLPQIFSAVLTLAPPSPGLSRDLGSERGGHLPN